MGHINFEIYSTSNIMYFNPNSGVLLIFFRNLNTSVYFFNQTKISKTFIIHQFWSVGITTKVVC